MAAMIFKAPPQFGQCSAVFNGPALATRPSRSSASRSIDNYLGGIFLHWWFAPSGRTATIRHRIVGLK